MIHKKGPRAAPTAYAGNNKIVNHNSICSPPPGQIAPCDPHGLQMRLSDSDSKFERMLCAARRRWELRGDPERAARFARLVALLRQYREVAR